MELCKGDRQFFSTGRKNFPKENATLLRRIVFLGGDLKSNKMKGYRAQKD
jgi:hypothetical protein